MFQRPPKLEDILKHIHDQMEVVELDEPAPPACVTCNDTGYIRYDLHYTDPAFGKLHPCPEPNCPVTVKHRQAQSSQVMKHSTWEQDYEGYTFVSFAAYLKEQYGDDWTGKRGAYAAAHLFSITANWPFTLQQAAQQVFSKDWPGADDRASNSLVLTGDVGVGKTVLAAAVTNALRAQNWQVVFIRALDLITRVQETYAEDWQGKTPDQVKRFFGSVDYLILDEFGIKNYKSDRLEIIEDIIRERDRRGLPFMMTTNLTLEQVYDLWQPQIADIAAKAHWVEMGGMKLRQTARKVEQW